MKFILENSNFVPYDKMSKKQKAEEDRKNRGSWNGVNPVSRTVPDKTKYDRNRDRKIPTDESLNETLIEAPQEIIDEVVKVLDSYGFILDPIFKVNPGKTGTGNVHMQVISTKEPVGPHYNLKRYVPDTLVDQLHEIENTSKCPITWNFGVNRDGYVTGGIDIRKKYVEDLHLNKLKKINESPDIWGLPTDDELEQEFDARRAEVTSLRNEYEKDLEASIESFKTSFEAAQAACAKFNKSTSSGDLETLSLQTVKSAYNKAAGYLRSCVNDGVDLDCDYDEHFGGVHAAINAWDISGLGIELFFNTEYGLACSLSCVLSEDEVFHGDKVWELCTLKRECALGGQRLHKSRALKAVDLLLGELRKALGKNESYKRHHETRKMNEGVSHDEYMELLEFMNYLVDSRHVDAEELLKSVFKFLSSDDLYKFAKSYELRPEDWEDLEDWEDEDED